MVPSIEELQKSLEDYYVHEDVSLINLITFRISLSTKYWLTS